MTATLTKPSQNVTQADTDEFEEITIQPGQDPFRDSYTVISNALMDCDCKTLFDQPSHKFLLITILRWYNIDVGKAWAGQETLANQTGLSIKTIQRAADGLQARGWIKIDRQWKDGKRHNTYRLTNKVFTLTNNPQQPPKQKQKPPKTVSKPTQNSGKQYKTKPKTQQQQTQPRNYWDQEQQKRPQPQQWQGLQPIQKIPKQTFTNLIQNTKQQLTKTRDPTPI